MITKPLLSPINERLYTQKSNSRGRIWHRPDMGFLEFYPAGYSKECRLASSTMRQDIHRILWEQSVNAKTENETFPLNHIKYDIRFERDIGNEYDPHATFVVMDSDIMPGKSIDIGYVPAEISADIAKSIKSLEEEGLSPRGSIYKVKRLWDKRLYTAKVVFHYRHKEIPEENDTELSRFSELLLEL